jgi:glycerol-3-phosphate acyltransferase PlsY
VATALGVVLFLAPGGSVAGLIGFLLCLLASRIVALSSMTAAIAFAIGQIAILWPNPFNGEKLPLAVFSLAVPALIVLRHRSNIKRLLRGEEQQFQFGGSQAEPSEEPNPAVEAEEPGEASASPWG